MKGIFFLFVEISVGLLGSNLTRLKGYIYFICGWFFCFFQLIGVQAGMIILNAIFNEIVYEISDFLYHVMVLMVEKGVSWEDITDELSRR